MAQKAERGLYQRKDSPYWWVDLQLPDGSRVCQSTRHRDLAAANEFVIELKAKALQRQKDEASKAYRWPAAVNRYLQESWEKKTLDMDKLHLKALHPYIGDKYLTDISMDTLRPFINKRQREDRVTNATINRQLEVVRRILHLARDEWMWLQGFPKVKMLKEPVRRVRYLSYEEADRLLGTLPKHLKPVVQFALATGCRAGEILAMEWQRVDLDRRAAWLEHGATKSEDARGIPLIEEAIAALTSVQGQHPRWCFTYRGERMSEVGEAFKRSLRRCGIEDFRFHDLRHTWASWHVMNGTSLQSLMELGGWKSYEMVLRYAHLAPDHLHGSAANIERKLISANDDVGPTEEAQPYVHSTLRLKASRC